MSDRRQGTLAWLRRVLQGYFDGHPVVAPVTNLPAHHPGAVPKVTATLTLSVTNGTETVTHLMHRIDLSGPDAIHVLDVTRDDAELRTPIRGDQVVDRMEPLVPETLRLVIVGELLHPEDDPNASTRLVTREER